MSYFNLVKMNSPKGTNHEGWYIAKQSPLGPVMAMDTKMKARDDAPEGTARRLADVILALKEQLGDDDFREICATICGEQDEPEASEDDEDEDDKPVKDAKRKQMGKDTPPPFEDMPKTGAAMDAASDKRFDFVADAMRVKPGTGEGHTDRSSQARRAPVTASAERSFGEMYGAAAVNIKVR